MRILFIDYSDNGIPAAAFSVTIDIHEHVSGTVIDTITTSVYSPYLGRYQFDLDAQDGIVYDVTWTVLPSATSNPRTITQEVGPFASSNQSYRAIPEYKGTLAQGTNNVLFLKVSDFTGEGVNPYPISFQMFDQSGNVQTLIDTQGISSTTIIPEIVKQGLFAWDWNIPLTFTAGNYSIVWTYVIDGTTRIEIQNIIVSADASDSEIYSGAAREFIAMLSCAYLGCAQSIPVMFEQNKPSQDYKTYDFSFKNWNQNPLRIYRNKKLLTGQECEVDFSNGRIIFDNTLSNYDAIYVDYNFRWFSDEKLYTYIQNAIGMLNIYPPTSPVYSIYNLPDRFVPLVLGQAAILALRSLMLCLQFQQPQQVFGGSDAANQAFSNLETLKKNYEEEIKALYEQKKLGRYPRTMIINNSTMSLPGGRSRWYRNLFSNSGIG